MWRVLAAIAVGLGVAFTACLYQFADPAGPVEFELSDITPLPPGYRIAGEQQSCGQGMRPVDCAGTVVIAGPTSATEQQVVEAVSERLCRRKWRCETGPRRTTAKRRSLFGRQDEAVVEPGADVPDWTEISLNALRRSGRPWVVLSYDSARD